MTSAIHVLILVPVFFLLLSKAHSGDPDWTRNRLRNDQVARTVDAQKLMFLGRRSLRLMPLTIRAAHGMRKQSHRAARRVGSEIKLRTSRFLSRPRGHFRELGMLNAMSGAWHGVIRAEC